MKQLDRTSQMREQALRLFHALVAVQRNARTHSLTNAAMAAPMEALRSQVADVIAMQSQCEFLFSETVCVLNGVMATPELPMLGVVREVTEAFNTRYVGGFRVTGVASPEQMQALVDALLAGRVGSEPRFAFEVLNVSIIRQMLQRLHEQEVADIVNRDPVKWALSLYAALLRSVQATAFSMRAAGQARDAVSTSRIIRESVDAAMSVPDVILQMALLRDTRIQYLQRHLVGTTLLSILVGIEMCLPRGELLQLARVALFHEIGMRVYGDHLEQARDLTPFDRMLVKEMPLLSARSYLRRKGLDFETLRSVVSAVECKRSFDDPLTPGSGPTKVTSITTMAARIVQVCSTFDALTSDRPFRGAMPIPVAVETLSTGATRFDPRAIIGLMRVLAGVKRPQSEASGPASKARTA